MGSSNSKKLQRLSPKTIEELKKNVAVDFSSEEIKEWYDEYNKSLRNGKTELTRNEFIEVYDTLFVGNAAEFAAQVFRTFDDNGNGSVDFKEFITGMCISGSSEYDTKLKWAFKMYDINGDGYISIKEMTDIISAIYKMTNVTAPRDLGEPEDMAGKLFDAFDLNHDGKISYDEFRIGAKNDPVIVKLLECDPDPDAT